MGLFGFLKDKGDEKPAESKKPVDNEAAPLPPKPGKDSEPARDVTADAGPSMQRKAEDIIAQLNQINSILGEEGKSPTVPPAAKMKAEPAASATPEPGPLAPAEKPKPVATPPAAAGAPTDSVYIPAIEILSEFPPELLAGSLDDIASAHADKSDFAFSFNRTDIMYGLSQGKLAFKVSELMSKCPYHVFASEINQYVEQTIELPLHKVVPKVPPAWLKLQQQDTTRAKVVDEMDDLFDGFGEDKLPEEMPQPESAAEPVAAAAKPEPTPVAQKAEPFAKVVGENLHLDAIAVLRRIPSDLLLLSVDEIAEQAGGELTCILSRLDVQAAVQEDGSFRIDLPVLVNKFNYELFQEEVNMSLDTADLPSDEILSVVPGEWYADEAEPVAASTPEPVPPPPVAEPVPPPPVAEPVPPPPVAEPVPPPPVAKPVPPPPVAEPVATSTPEPVSDEAPTVVSEDKPKKQWDGRDTYKIPRGEEAVIEPEITVPPPDGKAPPQGILMTDSEQISTDADTVERIPVPPVSQPPGQPAPVAMDAPEARTQDDAVSADEIKSLGQEIFRSEEQRIKFDAKDEPADSTADEAVPLSWHSQAPNGIDINRSGIEQLCLLNNVGPVLAQSIVDYRRKNGLFRELKDLTKVVGLGSKTFREMAGLSLRSDLRTAEMRLNKLLGIKADTVNLGQIAKAAVKQFDLSGVFIGSTDGLILAKDTSHESLAKFADPLAAVAPQLYKRGQRTLAQANLPECDMFTFFLGNHAVTFAGSDQVFCATVHDAQYPSQRQLKNCRKLAEELVWYCSYRAVL